MRMRFWKESLEDMYQVSNHRKECETMMSLCIYLPYLLFYGFL